MARYKMLRGMYYTDKEKYEKEYAQRVGGVSTTHLGIETADGYPMFFVSIPETTNKIAKIYRENDKVVQSCTRLPLLAQSQFATRSLVEEIRLTLEIENVHSTRKEINRVINKAKDDHRYLRLQGMVGKYKALLAGSEMKLTTLWDVRALYDEFCLPEVLEEDADNAPDGEIFRKGPVVVQGKGHRAIHEGVYPEHKILTMMEKALALMHDDNIELLTRCAIFHYLFAYIHPFYDGNGRLARFVTSSMLSQLHPLIGVRISYTIKESKETYYRLFKMTNEKHNRGDLTAFIDGFLGFILSSYENLNRALEQRVNALIFYREKIKAITQDKSLERVLFLLLQVTLFGEEGMNMQGLQENLSMSRGKLLPLMKKGRDAHWIWVEKVGKAHVYRLDLDAVDAQTPEDVGT